MANTFKFGNGNWAVKEDYALAYNDENGNFKPLPFDFTRASTATRVNKDGLIETVPSGKPRIDFTDNTSGHLLLEPSRENKFPYSNQKVSGGLETFTSGTASITVTNNYATSPDGSQNAMRFQATCGSTSSDQTGLRDALSMSAASATLSFYGKSNTSSSQTIAFHFNGGTKTVVTLTNEWQRFTYTDTSGTTNNAGVEIRGTYTDTDVDVLLFGFQMEQASYATSYIPTSGSTVTRSGETCSGAGNSTVFNDSEGVLFVEMAALDNQGSATSTVISINDGTSSNRIHLFYFVADNTIYANYRSGGTTRSTAEFTLSNTANVNKFAYKWKSGDFALWVNGVEVDTDTNTTMISSDTLDELDFYAGGGGANFYGKTKDLRVYNTALSDSELQALTSN